jgi:hypothetical protein
VMNSGVPLVFDSLRVVPVAPSEMGEVRGGKGRRIASGI